MLRAPLHPEFGGSCSPSVRVGRSADGARNWRNGGDRPAQETFAVGQPVAANCGGPGARPGPGAAIQTIGMCAARAITRHKSIPRRAIVAAEGDCGEFVLLCDKRHAGRHRKATACRAFRWKGAECVGLPQTSRANVREDIGNQPGAGCCTMKFQVAASCIVERNLVLAYFRRRALERSGLSTTYRSTPLSRGGLRAGSELELGLPSAAGIRCQRVVASKVLRATRGTSLENSVL